MHKFNVTQDQLYAPTGIVLLMVGLNRNSILLNAVGLFLIVRSIMSGIKRYKK